MLDYINPLSEEFILKDVLSFLVDILSYINPFSDNFLLKGVLDFLSNIISYINPFSDNFLGKKIIEMLQGVLEYLFVPDNSLINEKIEEIKSRFAFVDGVKQTINEVTNIVYDENSSPSLSINIPDNKTGITKMTIIDLSWYTKYKNYGDTIICCFIYAFFFWRIFIKLPNIIGGHAGSVSSIIDSGIKIGGKESRSK